MEGGEKGLNPLLSGSVFLTAVEELGTQETVVRRLNPLLSGSVFLTTTLSLVT